MEKITLKQVSRNEKTSKAGKPYISLGIKCAEHEGFINGFGNKDNQDWKAGDIVEVIIEKKEYNGKEYLNFSTPKKEDVANEDIADIKKKVNLMYHMITQLYKLQIKEAVVESNPDYPVNDQDPSQIPF